MALMSDAGYYWLGSHKFWPLSKAAYLHSRIYEMNDNTEIVDCCRRPNEWSVVVVFVLWILLSPLTFRLRLQYVPTWILETLSIPTMLPRRRKNTAGRARAVHVLGTESRYHLFILERTFLLMLDPIGRSLSQQFSRPSPAYRCHQKDTILKREISWLTRRSTESWQ
jgi:hypothetical protein